MIVPGKPAPVLPSPVQGWRLAALLAVLLLINALS